MAYPKTFAGLMNIDHKGHLMCHSEVNSALKALQRSFEIGGCYSTFNCHAALSIYEVIF